MEFDRRSRLIFAVSAVILAIAVGTSIGRIVNLGIGKEMSTIPAVQFPEFKDEIVLQQGQPMVFTNPNEDTYYLQYTITGNGGKEIYKSDLVPPETTADHATAIFPSFLTGYSSENHVISFTGSDVFAKGENTVTVTVNAYKGADFTPCQAATQQRIKVSVE